MKNIKLEQGYQPFKLVGKAIGNLAEKINKDPELPIIKPDDYISIRVVAYSYYKDGILIHQPTDKSNPFYKSEFYEIIQNNGNLDGQFLREEKFSPRLVDFIKSKDDIDQIDQIFIKIEEYIPDKKEEPSLKKPGILPNLLSEEDEIDFGLEETEENFNYKIKEEIK